MWEQLYNPIFKVFELGVITVFKMRTRHFSLSIGKHINNALKEELMDDSSVVANFATTGSRVAAVVNAVITQLYSTILKIRQKYEGGTLVMEYVA